MALERSLIVGMVSAKAKASRGFSSAHRDTTDCITIIRSCGRGNFCAKSRTSFTFVRSSESINVESRLYILRVCPASSRRFRLETKSALDCDVPDCLSGSCSAAPDFELVARFVSWTTGSGAFTDGPATLGPRFARGLESRPRTMPQTKRAAAPQTATASKRERAIPQFKKKGPRLNDFHRTFRQRLQKRASVRLRHNAVVQNHDNTVIALCPNQPSHSLAHLQDRLRQRVFREWIAAAGLDHFEARFNQRMIWNRERQPRDNHIRKRFTGNIDSHPETVRAKQHAPRGGLELFQQPTSRGPGALHEQIHFLFREKRFQARGDLLHPAITRKEHKRASLGLADKMRDPFGQRLFVAVASRIGHLLHDKNLHLLRELEGAPEL